MLKADCDNILIRGVNWVGEAVMTMPAIRAINKAFSGKTKTLLVRPRVSPLFEKDPNIDEILVYGEQYKGVGGRYRLGKYLKEKNFCLAILLQNAFDAAVITWLAGIPERVGYNRDGRGFLLTKPIPYNKEDSRMNHINYHLEMLRRAGIDAPYSEPWLYLELSERLAARGIFINMKRPVVGISPGGHSKRWPQERFAALITKIVGQMNGSVAIFGGESESEASEEMLSRIPEISRGGSGRRGGRVLDMTGNASLREVSALISECDALAGGDSDLMQIGYAVRIPLVSVSGSAGPSLGVEDVFADVKRAIAKDPAVFFDRDGTLCRDADYLARWEDFEVFPEVGELKRLKETGFKLIGVTNQSGIARGMINESFVKEVNDVFIRQYGFDGFYYCPHHPDEHCPCRKPEPEMPLKARAEHGIDLKSSYVVGDKEADLLLARAIGAKAVLVLANEKPEASPSGAKWWLIADFIARDLKEAVDWILKNG